MNFKISPGKKNSLNIKIEKSGHDPEKIMNSLNDCKNGNCTCPTNEYDKLEKIEITEDNDNIAIRLISKNGGNIDQKSIEKCVAYTLDESSSGQ